jgi:hypothetical protein
MSGFLLRLAASVRNPGGEIHPTLGSIFSSSRYQSGAEDGIEQNSFRTPEREISSLGIQQDAGAVTVMRPPQRSPADLEQNSSVPFSDSQMPVTRSPEKVQDRQGLERAPVEKSSDRSIVKVKKSAETIEEADPPKSVISPADESRPSTVPFEPKPVDLPPAMRSQSVNQLYEERAPIETLTGEMAFQKAEKPEVVPIVARKERYQPLLAEQAPRIEERISTPFPTKAPRRERSDFSGRAVALERQPDEIQIHIGRIEVVAVPPVPVRAAPKPPNKSPNLSDYLKLRHGRA